MALFEKLLLWLDPVLRSGPEAMAIDEWLLDKAKIPVLRIYGWAGHWTSIGYFGKFTEASAAFPGVSVVRRWTGGGIVDHRWDWTYTVVAPHGEPLAGCRGAESYAQIHTALAGTLAAEGLGAISCQGELVASSVLCFENPVDHDLLRADRTKLAGAGQRRSRQGLLHQGSVAAQCATEAGSRARAENFANRIARTWGTFPSQPEPAEIARRMDARYARDAWTRRR